MQTTLINSLIQKLRRVIDTAIARENVFKTPSILKSASWKTIYILKNEKSFTYCFKGHSSPRH